MRDFARSVELLRLAVNAEALAAAQYNLDAAVLENAGLPALAARSRQEAEEERTHLAMFQRRMTVLRAVSQVAPAAAVPSLDVPAIFARVGQLEQEAIELYSRAATECLAAGDHVTRDLFASVLSMEEEHLNWVEAQMALIADVGLQNYLTSQMGVPHA